MRENIIAGIVANIITTSIFTLLGVGTLISIFIFERQKLLSFFGITKNKPNIHIYTSRLEIVPGGAKGAEPITKGYVGPAIIRIEYLGGLLVRRLFRSRILALVPKELKDILSKIHISLLDIDPAIDASPIYMTNDVIADDLILIGTGIYNYVSRHYLSQQNSPYYFDKNAQGERIVKARCIGNDLEIRGRISNQELSIIERINDRDSGATIFICAGLGSSASFGSVRYLVQNWKNLQRRYGQGEFAFCLAFDNQLPDSETVVEPKIIHEPPRGLS